MNPAIMNIENNADDEIGSWIGAVVILFLIAIPASLAYRDLSQRPVVVDGGCNEFGKVAITKDGSIVACQENVHWKLVR